MNRTDEITVWRRVLDDYVTSGHWPGVTSVSLAPVLEENKYVINPHLTERTLFGLPVCLNSSVPANELRLVGSDGGIIRVVNIGGVDAGRT
jgi:hypothetical protein